MIISIDTETTGLDPFHGCIPFFVSICDDKQSQTYYDWDVNPVNRYYYGGPPKRDAKEIQEWINDADTIVFHNFLFDTLMLNVALGIKIPWDKVVDTMRCSHVLRSSEAKDLDTLSLVYLGADISLLKKKVNDNAIRARRIVKSKLPHWWRATDDHPMLPSGGGPAADMWMPKALAVRRPDLLPDIEDGQGNVTWAVGSPVEKHPWYTNLRDYGNMDPAVTVAVYLKMIDRIKREDRYDVFKEMNRQNEIVFNLAKRGVTANWKRLYSTISKYRLESMGLHHNCKRIAKEHYDYDLELPKGANNHSLLNFVFDEMAVKVKRMTKKGNASLDKESIAHYVDTLPPGSHEQDFFECLQRKRKLDTATSYLSAYHRFGIPHSKGTLRLHPSYNTSKNVTLRWASYNPNSQNISKQEGFNCRVPYGPAPGRRWASLDYDNLELRIPAYECQEPAMLELFEHPDRAPYFGSYHLLIFSILHPEKYDHDDPQGLVKAKDKYKSTWYQWTKNGNFAEIYGAVDTHDGNSTADRAFHMPGAQEIVAKRLKKKTELNQYWIEFAQRYGYVETMPDKEVDPERGYPLQCPKNYYGKVRPTVPLNYHVQGTAMWVIIRAMLKVRDYIETLHDWHFTLQVHDEIVLDFPASDTRYIEKLQKVRLIMESVGDCVGVPLTCGCTIHDEHWAKGYDLERLAV